VLSVTEIDENSAEVVLVSPNEVEVGKTRTQINNEHIDLEEYINSKIVEASLDGIDDWRLPTLAELVQLNKELKTANNLFNSSNSLNDSKSYLCTLEDVVIMHLLKSTEGSTNQTDFSKSDLIRPFVTIHITEE
jgi:hypothetical protein